MFRWLDRSPLLAKLLEKVSNSLAKQRGLLAMIGILLVIISFIVQLLNLVLPSPWLEFAWAITHHLGIIIALIGFLLVEPLGR
jgi:hypothetical protein